MSAAVIYSDDVRSFDLAVTAAAQRVLNYHLNIDDWRMTLKPAAANAGTVYVGGGDAQTYPLATYEPYDLDGLDPYNVYYRGTAADVVHVLMFRKKVPMATQGAKGRG